MLALLFLFPGFAVAVLSLAAAQVLEYFIPVLVSKCDLLHKPTVHHSCFEFGSPIFSASGMATGHIPGKVGVSEPGDSHLGRWQSSLRDRLVRRGSCVSGTFTPICLGRISRPLVVVMSGW